MHTSGSASNIAHWSQGSGTVGMHAVQQQASAAQPGRLEQGFAALYKPTTEVMPLLGKACLTSVKVVATSKITDGEVQAGAVTVPSAQHIVWLAIQPGHLALMHTLQGLQDSTVTAV